MPINAETQVVLDSITISGDDLDLLNEVLDQARIRMQGYENETAKVTCSVLGMHPPEYRDHMHFLERIFNALNEPQS